MGSKRLPGLMKILSAVQPAMSKPPSFEHLSLDRRLSWAGVMGAFHTCGKMNMISRLPEDLFVLILSSAYVQNVIWDNFVNSHTRA